MTHAQAEACREAVSRPAAKIQVSVSHEMATVPHVPVPGLLYRKFKAMKEVAKGLKIDLANYNEMLSFSQFGSDLDKETKRVLTHGKALMEVLKQKQYAPYSLSRQVVELYAAKNRYLDDLEVKEIPPFLERLYSSISSKHPEILKTIDETKALGPELSASLKAAVEEFKGSYSA